MWERNSSSGHTVEWNPPDTDTAAEAMANVQGTGVSTATEAKSNATVSLGEDTATARAVQEEYFALKDANTS